MKITVKIASTILLIFICFACKQEYDNIGLNLINENLGNSFSDTTSIYAFSIKNDSILTKNVGSNIAGTFYDYVFGKTTSGFYAKYCLVESSVNFGSNPVLDSIVLVLQYAGYYGDTMSQLKFEIYQLTGTINDKDKYFSDSHIDYDQSQNLVYNQINTFYPKPNSNIRYLNDTIVRPPHIRVRLSDALGNSFINAVKEGKFSTNAQFQEFFNGLYVTLTTSSSTGCLVNFNMRGSIAALNLYYHNDSNTGQFYVMNTPSSSTCFTEIRHDYSLSSDFDFKSQIIDGNRSLGKQKLYLQPLGGIKTYIKFPYIYDTFKGKDIIVNKAELVISDMGSEGFLLAPSTLNFQLISNDSTYTFLLDAGIGASYFGGVYDKATKSYKFRITKYIQQLIMNQVSTKGLYLVISGDAIQGNRLIFRGTDKNIDKHLRLDIYYTIF